MTISAENTGTGKRVSIKHEITDSGPAHFLSAHIADKKSNSSEYEYTVPGYAVSNCGCFASASATANSTGAITTANAWGLGTANCSTVSAELTPWTTACQVQPCRCSCQMAASL